MTLTRNGDYLQARPLIRLSNVGSKPATVYKVDLDLTWELGEIGPFGFKTDDSEEPLPLRLEEGDLKNFTRTVRLGPIAIENVSQETIDKLDAEQRRQLEQFNRLVREPGSFVGKCVVAIRSTVGEQQFTQPVEVNFLGLSRHDASK